MSLIFVALFDEKRARAAMMSAAERNVSKDALVVVDAMNYIKGYRYQLYCYAKNACTLHAVLFCDSPVEQCRQWNRDRSEDSYQEEV
jgi:protein KTI12